jgi:hypothetical protein
MAIVALERAKETNSLCVPVKSRHSVGDSRLKLRLNFASARALEGKARESSMSNPNEKVDHSSKAPLKSDMKAGVQPNQQPGVKIPKKEGEHPEGTQDQGKS